MAIIERNDYGAIAVNNRVLCKMIVGKLLSMSDSLLPCNKKGKIIKNNPTPFIDPDLYDSVEIIEKKANCTVTIYIVAIFGLSISNIANTLMDQVEECFELLKLDKPSEITVAVKGVMAKQLVKRDLKVNRFNEQND